MSRFSKWEAHVAKHNHIISPLVLSFVFILVLDLITPTLLLASELTDQNAPYINDNKSERAQLEMQRLEFLKKAKENAVNTEKQVKKIRTEFNSLKKQGVAIPTSTWAKVERTEQAVKTIKSATVDSENIAAKQEEMKKLYSQLKTDQQNLMNLRESVKKAEAILKNVNKTVVEMRTSLAKARAQMLTNPEKAKVEMQNYFAAAEKLKKLDYITPVSEVKEKLETVKPLPVKETAKEAQYNLAESGMCLVRDAYTSLPNTNDPKVGKGYAYLIKTGVNSVSGLRWECSQEDYTKLLRGYCEINSNPVQLQFSVLNKLGGGETTGCSGFGCGTISCPQPLPAPVETNTTSTSAV